MSNWRVHAEQNVEEHNEEKEKNVNVSHYEQITPIKMLYLKVRKSQGVTLVLPNLKDSGGLLMTGAGSQRV